MNWGQVYAGFLILGGIAGSWLPIETAINPGLIVTAGFGLYYLARIDERLENIAENTDGDGE